ATHSPVQDRVTPADTIPPAKLVAARRVRKPSGGDRALPLRVHRRWPFVSGGELTGNSVLRTSCPESVTSELGIPCRLWWASAESPTAPRRSPSKLALRDLLVAFDVGSVIDGAGARTVRPTVECRHRILGSAP